jgi:hypothetical protein
LVSEQLPLQEEADWMVQQPRQAQEQEELPVPKWAEHLMLARTLQL